MSEAKRQMQFYSLHSMTMISFICRKSLLIRDQAWFMKSQHYGSFANTTFAHSKHEKLRTEPTWGNAWQTHAGYQIRQSHWLSCHWICSLTVSSARSSERNTFLMSRTKTGSPKIYATWLIDLSYWIKRDLRDAFLWSFLVTCELAVRFLSFCQLWMELVSVLESYWWEMENQVSRIWPLCVCTCNCVCVYTLRNTHKNIFDSSIPY